MAYTPSGNKVESGKTNFGGLVPDSNRIGLTGYLGSNFQTQDATTVPVTSPTTVNTTATITVPNNATSIVICSVTNPVQVSEDSTQSVFFTLPAGIPWEFQVARQQFVYLKTSGSTVVSFYFPTIQEVILAIKTPTAWQPPSGTGYVITIGLLNIQDNLGNLLQDNLGNLLVTNPTYDIPKNSTLWTGSGA